MLYYTVRLHLYKLTKLYKISSQFKTSLIVPECAVTLGRQKHNFNSLYLTSKSQKIGHKILTINSQYAKMREKV